MPFFAFAVLRPVRICQLQVGNKNQGHHLWTPHQTEFAEPFEDAAPEPRPRFAEPRRKAPKCLLGTRVFPRITLFPAGWSEAF